MGLAAVRTEFAEIFTPPPSVDLASAVVGDDLKSFEHMVDEFEAEQTAWRVSTALKYRATLENGHNVARSVGREEMWKFCQDSIVPLLSTFDEALEKISIPLHELPETIDKLRTIQSMSVSAARFLRKQLRRVERIRVLSYNAIVEWEYGLRAFISEFEPEEERGPTFSDPAELESFIRSSLT